jgi:hypothetical protein
LAPKRPKAEKRFLIYFNKYFISFREEGLNGALNYEKEGLNGALNYEKEGLNGALKRG